VYEAVDLSEEFIILEKLFEGVSLIGDYSKKEPNLSKGELLSAKLLTAILIEKNSCSFYRYA
jgi:aspartokinase/homoserine dehydrogenase 1